MAYHHGFQASRYELKYIIDESCAANVRDFVRSFLVPDEHADPNRGNSYPVHSLYLDTPGLALFRSTVDGLKNRFKLRIRFYDDDPRHPAFLEIKRRLTEVICKERAAVTREGARRLLEGKWLDPSYLMTGDKQGKAAAALHNFCRTTHSIGAVGCVYVSYNREAYVSPDSDQVRVTFDRRLHAGNYRPVACLVPPAVHTPVPIGGGRLVLELKYTDRFPEWMREMVLAFNLVRVPMAKYVACVQAVGYPWLSGLGTSLGVAS
jgi:hypothetical protein